MSNRVQAETRKRARKVNEQLFNLGKTYFDYIPVYQIDSILVDNGFEATEPAIYCGRDGKVYEEVGQNMYLSMTWHKKDETGRYEIVAYLS